MVYVRKGVRRLYTYMNTKTGKNLSAKLNYFCKLKMYIMHRVAHIFSVTLGLAGVLNIHYLVIMAPVKDCDILGSK